MQERFPGGEVFCLSWATGRDDGPGAGRSLSRSFYFGELGAGLFGNTALADGADGAGALGAK